MAKKVEREPDGSGMLWMRLSSPLAMDEQVSAPFMEAVTVAVAAAVVWRT